MKEEARPADEAKRRSCLPCGCQMIFGLVVLSILAGVALGPIGHGRGFQYANSRMQQVHAIGLTLYSYAIDNNRVYPTGNSSTEVFQKLLDGGYVTDPALFYFPYLGKTVASPGQKLKPENVCFDFTDGATLDSLGGLPLVFLSGYRVTYAPGTRAVPRFHPMPYEESWFHRWFDNGMDEDGPIAGSAVYTVDNSVKWVPDRSSARFKSLDDPIPHFIPPDFKPDGKIYRQLTPEGPLAP